jgi:hypothetical protein
VASTSAMVGMLSKDLTEAVSDIRRDMVIGVQGWIIGLSSSRSGRSYLVDGFCLICKEDKSS